MFTRMLKRMQNLRNRMGWFESFKLEFRQMEERVDTVEQILSVKQENGTSEI